ncbi:MAG: addiction module protein [Gemmatimonadetes bacterium]|nr:addiction module protein [Gemmatimonadota bacterium]
MSDYRAGGARTRPVDDVLDEAETRVERAWAAEIRERIRALEAGEMKVLSEEEAQAEAEELLR